MITEKATTASEQNKVVFNVPLTATKPQIKEAVETLFNVKVKAVNTLCAKARSSFPRPARQAADVKKAIVTLTKATPST